MFTYLIFGITFAFAAAVQPGPFQAFIISQTLEKGWRKTLPAAFAPVISDGPILLLVLFFLSKIPGNFVAGLRILGGLLLLFLAYQAYISWKKYDAGKAASPGADKKTLVKAVLVNFFNPGPWLGWSLIMGPLFLEGWRIAPANGIILIISFYLTMIITLIGIILLFTFARRFGPGISKTLIGLSALALLVFGIYQLWKGLTILGPG